MGNNPSTSPPFPLPKYTNASCDHDVSGTFKTVILSAEMGAAAKERNWQERLERFEPPLDEA